MKDKSIKESYTLVLNSTNATNRTGTAPNFTYLVNWETILEKQCSYSISFSFHSTVVASAFTELYTLSINFGSSNVYSQSASPFNQLGFLHHTMQLPIVMTTPTP